MPIGCAGVAVYPGDVLIGDRDGVMVIPRHLAAEIAEQGHEQEQLEAYVSTKIHAGEPLWGNYPPGEEHCRVQGLDRRRHPAGISGRRWRCTNATTRSLGGSSVLRRLRAVAHDAGDRNEQSGTMLSPNNGEITPTGN